MRRSPIGPVMNSSASRPISVVRPGSRTSQAGRGLRCLRGDNGALRDAGSDQDDGVSAEPRADVIADFIRARPGVGVFIAL
jgi:hypothetical protein